MPSSSLNRRSFLKLGAFAALAGPRLISAAEPHPFLDRPERSLSIYNLHTTEKISTVYWARGEYVPESLADINKVLRDYRTDEVFHIEPRLLDTLCELHMRLETTEPFELISGYRSPATNSMLRGVSHGVAEKSLHLKGMAADVRVPGRNLDLLRRTAVAMKAGGVGYYPVSQFVHVDVGRVRIW